MNDVNSEFLFEMSIDIDPPQSVGTTPMGKRYIAYVRDGWFKGPRLSGRVLPGGGDWVLVRSDHVFQLDVRITLETDDGALIYTTYGGVRHGAIDVMRRISAGEPVRADEYYFRTTPYFETAAEDYAWLNRIVAVGVGEDRPDGVTYQIHEIL